MDLENKLEDIEVLLESMQEYLTDYDCEEYTTADIEECKVYLETYINSLCKANRNHEKIKNCTKELIIALNKLNARLNYALIETEQREDLCTFILEAAAIAGWPDQNDFTEEWREW